MASTFSLRFRLNYQAPGDNLNLWGEVLNAGVFQLLEDAIAKRFAFTLSETKTLTTGNGVADEARSAVLDVTGGTGGTIIIPGVEKLYDVRNGASGDVIVTTGAGVTAVVTPGSVVRVFCDGSNVRLGRDAALATRDYVQGIAFGSVGNLPDVTGNAGKFVRSNGLTASWQFVTTADVSDYASDQATRAAAAVETAFFLAKHL